MTQRDPSSAPQTLRRLFGIMRVFAEVPGGWRSVRLSVPAQTTFWCIALLVGVASGFAAVGFRAGITALQSTAYGTDNIRALHSFAETLPWYMILLIPICGGLAVGLILQNFIPSGRVGSVAEVIEGAALKEGRVELRSGIASTCCSMITLSTGGSTGREGPVVHLAGLIATWVSTRLRADGITGRDLLGCAVAAAVSASFNAPIAGALFALEVILRHFAIHAFAPIVIASVAGTVISRSFFGDVTEFSLTDSSELRFYVELPAFLILGAISGLVAVALVKAVFFADDLGTFVQEKLKMKLLFRPVLAGAGLGALAIAFPHIIGVGYETTSAALTGELLLYEAIVFTAVKVFAVALTMAGRMGGGIFSPALMVGALTGLAFGLIATAIFPHVSGSETLYALAGLGAVAAAVLGAPISTTLIVFELTGDWQTGLAVMVAVSISTAISARLLDRSFFLSQLERRDIHLAAGPQAYLLALYKVSAIMRANDHPRSAPKEPSEAMVQNGAFVTADATLEIAMPLFEKTNSDFLPVVVFDTPEAAPRLIGSVFQVDALRAYNRALCATAAEEHS